MADSFILHFFASTPMTREPQWIEVGVGAIIAIMLLREVFGYLLKKKSTEGMTNMEAQIDDLHKWHDISDENGVKKWYVPRSMERSMDKLIEAVDRNTKVQEEVLREIKRVHPEGQK